MHLILSRIGSKTEQQTFKFVRYPCFLHESSQYDPGQCTDRLDVLHDHRILESNVVALLVVHTGDQPVQASVKEHETLNKKIITEILEHCTYLAMV